VIAHDSSSSARRYRRPDLQTTDSNLQPQIRCAIYTRKSTDEGLEQEFNSLDAQRESAEAYILSQRSEGWMALPDQYDDGGFSGGNMERPALKRLMDGIEAGKVDCVVVYKVDRLSRSLYDFARIMEAFERNHVSFVSVTQPFNTTTPAGRLMMNTLLNFAQFEREMTAERTRDKVSAARKRGRWTGGMPPLGYDVVPDGGAIVVNAEEAAQVRAIFELYLQHRSLVEVMRELDERAWRTKSWTTKEGKFREGRPWTKCSLHRLLTNMVYLGKVEFRERVYQGQHDAIVAEDVWQKTQVTLKHNGRNGGRDVRNKFGALLKGLILCASCNAQMVHAFSTRGSKRYRYYVCSRAQKRGWKTCQTRSLPAAEIENFVVQRIREIGNDPALLRDTLEAVSQGHGSDLKALWAEDKRLKGELHHLREEERSLITNASRDGLAGSVLANRLADIQDRAQTIERRQTEIREQIIAIQGSVVDEEDLKKALSLFDPVWDQLFPKEQARILRLLIERIDYHGGDGTLDITFRDVGIRTLKEELAGNE
jgi:site-specific DNA recombinase